MLKHLIEKEKERNLAAQARYLKAIEKLPKGKVYIRRVKGKKKGSAVRSYVYLSRRVLEKPHPESKYIGPKGSEKAELIIKQVEDRKRLEKELKALKLEMKMIEKALNE